MAGRKASPGLWPPRFLAWLRLGPRDVPTMAHPEMPRTAPAHPETPHVDPSSPPKMLHVDFCSPGTPGTALCSPQKPPQHGPCPPPGHPARPLACPGYLPVPMGLPLCPCAPTPSPQHRIAGAIPPTLVAPGGGGCLPPTQSPSSQPRHPKEHRGPSRAPRFGSRTVPSPAPSLSPLREACGREDGGPWARCPPPPLPKTAVDPRSWAGRARQRISGCLLRRGAAGPNSALTAM